MYEHIRNYQDIAEKTAFFYTTIFLGLGRAAEFIIKLQRFAETSLQVTGLVEGQSNCSYTLI